MGLNVIDVEGARMIRRIMQVEITPDEDDPKVCTVWVRNPRTGEVVATMSFEDTERWLEGTP